MKINLKQVNLKGHTHNNAPYISRDEKRRKCACGHFDFMHGNRTPDGKFVGGVYQGHSQYDKYVENKLKWNHCNYGYWKSVRVNSCGCTGYCENELEWDIMRIRKMNENG